MDMNMHGHEDCFKREHDIRVAWARAEDEVKVLKLKLDAWKRYHALLTEELDSAVGMAWIHGWRSSHERIARGKELRRELGIEEDSCPDCPPEKDCMKWNGCSCVCHKMGDS